MGKQEEEDWMTVNIPISSKFNDSYSIMYLIVLLDIY